jgi:hypothetical protein
MADSTIWKWPLPTLDAFTLAMPVGARPLAVQSQHGRPCLWALVDPAAPLVPRGFRIIGTGQPVPGPDWAYVGTFQMHGGDLVYHLFHEPGGEEPAMIDAAH